MFQNKHKRLTTNFIDKSAIKRYHSTSKNKQSFALLRPHQHPQNNWISLLVKNQYTKPRPQYVCDLCRHCFNHCSAQPYPISNLDGEYQYLIQSNDNNYEDNQEYDEDYGLRMKQERWGNKKKNRERDHSWMREIMADQLLGKQKIIGELKLKIEDLLTQNEKLVQSMQEQQDFMLRSQNNINKLKSISNKNSPADINESIFPNQSQLTILKSNQKTLKAQILALHNKIAQLTDKQLHSFDSHTALQQNKISLEYRIRDRESQIVDLQLKIEEGQRKYNALELEFNGMNSQLIGFKNEQITLRQNLEHMTHQNKMLHQRISDLQTQIDELHNCYDSLESKSCQELLKWNHIIVKIEETEEKNRQNERRQTMLVNQMQDSLCQNINQSVRRQNAIFSMLKHCEKKLGDAYGIIAVMEQKTGNLDALMKVFEDKLNNV